MCLARDDAALMGLLKQTCKLLVSLPRLALEGGPAAVGLGAEAVGGGIPCPDFAAFRERRSAWLRGVDDVLGVALARLEAPEAEGGGPARYNGVVALLSLLKGDEAAVEDSTGSWYEMLAASLLFQSPLCSVFDVCSLADKCLEAKPPPGGSGAEGRGGGEEEEEDDVLDDEEEANGGGMVKRYVTAVLSFELLEAVEVASHATNPWFVAHMLDLLHCVRDGGARMLEAIAAETETVCERRVGPAEDDVGRREFFCLRYATDLMTHPEMWGVAAAYLSGHETDLCPSRGGDVLSAAVENQRLGSVDVPTAVSALVAAGLDEAAQSASRVAAVQTLASGDLTAAVEHLGRAPGAGTAQVAAAVARRLIRELLGSDGLEGAVDERVLQILLDCMRGTPGEDAKAALFLFRYRMLRSEIVEIARLSLLVDPEDIPEDEDMARDVDLDVEELSLDAAARVIDLIRTDLVPAEHMLRVLFDAVPLLEGRHIAFDVEQTQALSEAFEKAGGVGPKKKRGEKADESKEALEREIIALALKRNATRAEIRRKVDQGMDPALARVPRGEKGVDPDLPVPKSPWGTTGQTCFPFLTPENYPNHPRNRAKASDGTLSGPVTPAGASAAAVTL